jgi:hypothetical protein
MTRKTKELNHEKLVTVFLGPLSDRHRLYLYMEIVARRTRRTKATDTDLYIFISNGKRVFGLFCGTNGSFRGTKTVFGV